MKFKSTKSLHSPHTKGILHQKSAYFEVSFFKNSEVCIPAKPRFLLIRIEAQTLLHWDLLMKTRPSLNNASFFRSLNQNLQLVCMNSPRSAAGQPMLVIVNGKWSGRQTLDQHWLWMPSICSCYIPSSIQGFKSLSSQKSGDQGWAPHGIQKSSHLFTLRSLRWSTICFSLETYQDKPREEGLNLYPSPSISLRYTLCLGPTADLPFPEVSNRLLDETVQPT